MTGVSVTFHAGEQWITIHATSIDEVNEQMERVLQFFGDEA